MLSICYIIEFAELREFGELTELIESSGAGQNRER
jgi:hypothetical protein